MKVAITGASGLVGEVAIRRFMERGDEVIAIGRSLDKLQALFANNVTCYESDYSREGLGAAFKGVDAIVHLAARRIAPFSEGYRPFAQANVQATENLVLAACDNGVDRLCQASSISVYSLQNNTVPFSESEPPVPMSLYGISKLACEHVATIYARRFPIRITSLRISRILGHDRTGQSYMLMRFMQQAKQKETIHLWGEGIGAHDTIYVKDVVGAIEQALKPDAPTGAYNIGGGRAFSHREILQTINEVFGNRDNLAFDTSKQEDTSVFIMDCARAEVELAWRRQWPLREAFEDLKDF
jgi:nucleoside-diphosphate-sugar epimerase